MVEYKFKCDSQDELVKVVNLLTERQARLDFELESVVSEELRKLRKAVEMLPYLLGKKIDTGEDLPYVKDKKIQLEDAIKLAKGGLTGLGFKVCCWD